MPRVSSRARKFFGTYAGDLSADDVQRYFATLYAQNPEAWAGLKGSS